MFSRQSIERYLFFLLRHKVGVSLAVAIVTIALGGFMYKNLRVFTNFFDLYPPNHPYIKLYQQYRGMFGTANTVLIVIETKNGTIFDSPETVQKVERITLELLHDIPGVNGDQVLSITHPKVKTTLTSGSGIKVVPLMYPRVPENKEDLEFLRMKVYTTEGVHGLFVSEDDRATQVVAGFWEEYFDLPQMWSRLQAIKAREEDANHTISITGIPILYAYFLEALPTMMAALGASVAMILLILWVEFRSWQGVIVPLFSGTLSATWGLGFASMYGLSLDPLVLVIPLLISARAHSHSVQSMERYHEEYHRLRNKDQAIVKSYTEIYAPAMVALLADALASLTLYVAHIPLIRNIAIMAAFWIASIFISVVTLHPIILSYTPPPVDFAVTRKGAFERYMSWFVVGVIAWLFWLYGRIPGAVPATFVVGSIIGGLADALLGIQLPIYKQFAALVSWTIDRGTAALSVAYRPLEYFLVWCVGGWRRQAVLVVLVLMVGFGLYFQQKVRIGDTTPGAALLYADHPYNEAFDKVNEKFLGASQLVVIAEGVSYCSVGENPCEGEQCTRCLPEEVDVCGKTEKCLQRPGAIKDAATLNHLDLFARHMSERDEVGGAVTAATLLKKIFRTFHEADPKWEILPTSNDHVAQLFFLLTSNTRRGEMDRFFDDDYTNATVAVFYKDYTHDTVTHSIARAKKYIDEHGSEAGQVRYRLAGGLLGILAATNEEVEWSYRVNLILILVVVFVLSYMTYVSVIGALIVMLPSLVAQPLSEAAMYWLGIDMNINSLPVAAIGIGIGIDYGYYVLSRIVEELPVAKNNFEIAIKRTLETTGRTVLVTGISLTASIIFWCWFPMKFQAEMALLLVNLLGFHLIGALVFIPPMVALFKPKFAIRYADELQRLRDLDAAAEADAAASASV